jgi:hypothetical protein
MAGQSLRAARSGVCAYCSEPLAMAAQGMKAASRRPVRLQQVLRRRNLVSGTGINVGAALPIGLAQGFIVLAFAVVVMLAVI